MRFDAKQLKEMSCSVRAHALHALRCAGAGHVGIVLGAADILTVIYANFLRRGRDRFVLSAGHGSALLYSVLKLAGYDVGNLDNFRKMGGLPGHPEFGTDGVMATTGPLGQGVGNAVGMALAAKIRGTDEMVYCLCSDGDLMEGVAAESIAFAGRYKLDNLVLLWDDNGVSMDGAALTDVDIPLRMRAAGWAALMVPGDDFRKIERALLAARDSRGPTFVQCKTQIGRDSSLAGTSAAHGFALSDGELMRLIEKSGVDPRGKSAVIVGRSNIVGKPMALLLLAADATVTVAHSRTPDLSAVTRNADILVAAVGRAKLIKADMVKPGAVVIDVGMNRDETGKLCGDVDFAEVKEIAGSITPVPGGVGPMTIAMLMQNTVLAAQMRHDISLS